MLQDLLIFVGIPLAVIALIIRVGLPIGLAGRPSGTGRGRDYTYAPVWFLAQPETDGPATARRGPTRSSARGVAGDSAGP